MVELVALIPELMAEHPTHGWTLTSDGSAGDGLALEIFPLASPERVAVVRVNASAEVFNLSLAGHESTDFAYEEESRTDTLRGRIDLAVAATLGPTRITVDRCEGCILGSTMVIDPDGLATEDAAASWPLRRLTARLLKRPIVREVIFLPGLGST